MGTPTSATVVYNDGRLQPFHGVDAALTQVETGREEADLGRESSPGRVGAGEEGPRRWTGSANGTPRRAFSTQRD